MTRLLQILLRYIAVRDQRQGIKHWAAANYPALLYSFTYSDNFHIIVEPDHSDAVDAWIDYEYRHNFNRYTWNVVAY